MDAERGVSVQDGGADLKFSDLAVEVARHEGLRKRTRRAFQVADPLAEAPRLLPIVDDQKRAVCLR